MHSDLLDIREAILIEQKLLYSVALGKPVTVDGTGEMVPMNHHRFAAWLYTQEHLDPADKPFKTAEIRSLFEGLVDELPRLRSVLPRAVPLRWGSQGVPDHGVYDTERQLLVWLHGRHEQRQTDKEEATGYLRRLVAMIGFETAKDRGAFLGMVFLHYARFLVPRPWPMFALTSVDGSRAGKSLLPCWLISAVHGLNWASGWTPEDSTFDLAAQHDAGALFLDNMNLIGPPTLESFLQNSTWVYRKLRGRLPQLDVRTLVLASGTKGRMRVLPGLEDHVQVIDLAAPKDADALVEFFDPRHFEYGPLLDALQSILHHYAVRDARDWRGFLSPLVKAVFS